MALSGSHQYDSRIRWKNTHFKAMSRSMSLTSFSVESRVFTGMKWTDSFKTYKEEMLTLYILVLGCDVIAQLIESTVVTTWWRKEILAITSWSRSNTLPHCWSMDTCTGHLSDWLAAHRTWLSVRHTLQYSMHRTWRSLWQEQGLKRH